MTRLINTLLGSMRWSILLLGLIGVAAAIAVAAAGQWSQQRTTEGATAVFVAKDVVADVLPPPMYLIELRLVLSQAVEGTMALADARRQVERLTQEYQARVEHWTRHPPYGLEQHLLGRQHEAARTFIAAVQPQVLTPLAAGDVETARRNLTQVHALYTAHRAGVDATVVAGNAFAEQSIAGFEAVRQRAWAITVGALLAGCAALLVCHRLVLHSVQAPLDACAALARRVAQGDLTRAGPPMPERRDRIGELQRSLEHMRVQLAQIVGQVRENADGVATASAQIAQGNQDLNDRNLRQAAALEETASAMRQFAVGVDASSGQAGQAQRLATEASQVAERGGEAVGRVVDTMKGINESSRRIADIIGAIEAIAFQTNILALNAAVEAARAGEQGRGFAVVATEVRSLAGRSAAAAREIRSLISASVERVERGTTLVDDAGRTITDVVASVRGVTGIIDSLSAASAEQTAGVAQVSRSVDQMDDVTQQNAALVEQSAAAAQALSGQARQLVQVVSVFKLEAVSPH